MKTPISINRFANRISGCLLAAVTTIGTLAPASASVLGASSALPHRPDPTSATAQMSSPEYSLVIPRDAHGNPNPRVHPPNSKPYGLTYGEWSAIWWQWLLLIPAATNPNLDASGVDCAEGQFGPVWFLAGSFGTLPSPIVRTCTVPAGKSLLLPILNQGDGAGLLDCGGPAPFDVSCANFTFNGKTGLAALREEAKVSQDNPALLELSLDGVALSDLTAYRAQSPVFAYFLTPNNVMSYLLAFFGFPSPEPPGLYRPAVSDGYWVMFTPLPPGHHTIHFEGVQAGGFATGGITYHLTVTP